MTPGSLHSLSLSFPIHTPRPMAPTCGCTKCLWLTRASMCAGPTTTSMPWRPPLSSPSPLALAAPPVSLPRKGTRDAGNSVPWGEGTFRSESSDLVVLRQEPAERCVGSVATATPFLTFQVLNSHMWLAATDYDIAFKRRNSRSCQVSNIVSEDVLSTPLRLPHSGGFRHIR